MGNRKRGARNESERLRRETSSSQNRPKWGQKGDVSFTEQAEQGAEGKRLPQAQKGDIYFTEQAEKGRNVAALRPHAQRSAGQP